jgi:meiotically up-regulated gene 157 (Mug157) protein
MWLRDSTNQVLPYVPYAPLDQDLQLMLEGVIARQARSVLIDSFANAFNYNASAEGHQQDTRTPPMQASVYEGKYEVDSLCAFLKVCGM